MLDRKNRRALVRTHKREDVPNIGTQCSVLAVFQEAQNLRIVEASSNSQVAADGNVKINDLIWTPNSVISLKLKRLVD